ncbi:MAG: hypothetical protein HQL56_14335 [Magnetococcales bacterium]|nr:hypothetical protein [Magnetococcales bacterium]
MWRTKSVRMVIGAGLILLAGCGKPHEREYKVDDGPNAMGQVASQWLRQLKETFGFAGDVQKAARFGADLLENDPALAQSIQKGDFKDALKKVSKNGEVKDQAMQLRNKAEEAGIVPKASLKEQLSVLTNSSKLNSLPNDGSLVPVPRSGNLTVYGDGKPPPSKAARRRGGPDTVIAPSEDGTAPKKGESLQGGRQWNIAEEQENQAEREWQELQEAAARRQGRK